MKQTIEWVQHASRSIVNVNIEYIKHTWPSRGNIMLQFWYSVYFTNLIIPVGYLHNILLYQRWFIRLVIVYVCIWYIYVKLAFLIQTFWYHFCHVVLCIYDMNIKPHCAIVCFIQQYLHYSTCHKRVTMTEAAVRIATTPYSHYIYFLPWSHTSLHKPIYCIILWLNSSW